MHFEELIRTYEKQRHEKNIFHDLMTWKVREILLVATMYDSFIVESDGALSEQIYGEYYQLNLSSAPRVTSVYTKESALETFENESFDMVILMAGLDLRTPMEIGARFKAMKPDITVLLLLNNNASLPLLDTECREFSCIDRTFVWNGYSKLFVGMIKYVEDLHNVRRDTGTGLVRVILLIEDSIRYYSRYLPIMHSVIMKQVQALIEDENLIETNKILRMRARPKILLATNYEEAKAVLERYEHYLLAIISDVRFKKEGNIQADAGIIFLKESRSRVQDVPFMIQSSELENRELAFSLGAHFSDKNSDSLDLELKNFIKENLGFGAFVFRDPAGFEIGRARNMEEFMEYLRNISAECLLHHAARNHFSAWLMARGEIMFAKILRQSRISDFDTLEDVRGFILKVIGDLRSFNNRGAVLSYDETALLDPRNIVRLATGSLGGKGRGITFIKNLVDNFDFEAHIPGMRVALPRTVMVGIDEFDSFVERNGLWKYAYTDEDYRKIRADFLAARLSDTLHERLETLVAMCKTPLAVRSSGLFEDMLMLPFSGIYDTFLIPNSHPDFTERVNQLESAIKLIYASMFSKMSKAYFEAACYKIEEERMAVVIQEVVGSARGNWFYPHFSGTAQSYNWYPVAYLKPEDGLCVSALGLGAWVVDGGESFRFCQKYPKLDILSPDNQVRSSQHSFYAIDLDRNDLNLIEGEEVCYATLDVNDADPDTVLRDIASTIDHENNRIVPGTSNPGPRLVNFAPILKYGVHPLSEVVTAVLELGAKAMGTPIEIEYAVNLSDPCGKPTFYILQIKPLLRGVSKEDVDLGAADRESVFLFSEHAMGNGRDEAVRDVVYVKPATFDRSKTETIAAEVEAMNEAMKVAGRKYVLIGPGRWGTRDRWLGIPVNFSQISNSRVIVETALESFRVESSLGSHFFHNVTSMNIGYFTIPWKEGESFIDWEWLDSLPAAKDTGFVRQVSLQEPMRILMDGERGASMILKPGFTPEAAGDEISTDESCFDTFGS